MDRVRVRAILERIAAGEDDLDAFWAVASDPRIGYSRYRGVAERPRGSVLMRKFASLFERAAPQHVAVARDVALAKLSALGEDAVRAVAEVVTGDMTDGRIARARLDAARTILLALGIGERPASLIATQVSVSQSTSSEEFRVPEGA